MPAAIQVILLIIITMLDKLNVDQKSHLSIHSDKAIQRKEKCFKDPT